MKGLKVLGGLLMTLVVGAAQAKEPPAQVVYRFDDHRYLELKGWDCVGALWYTDTQKTIHTEVVKQFYQIFTQPFIHPSEKYIAIPGLNVSEFVVSKDYGKTWQTAVFAPENLEWRLKQWSNQPVHPDRENTISFTVVNQRGYLLTRPYNNPREKQKKWMFMSSQPFDAPEMNTDKPINIDVGPDYKPVAMPGGFRGWSWGTLYITADELRQTSLRGQTNWQDLPDKVPEVKNYLGWEHMRCDMDAGK
ncbi:T6SS immunity protein Tli3 family protein [Rahnella perminowiae]|uniref:T6SS immunity protein Tli3 family protein n=1 Tax=Rahnella perminowiae TaxID=2816244 RepID=UPI00300F1696